MSIFGHISQGGPIMYILLFLNILGVGLMISKFLIFRREGQNCQKVTDALKNNLLASTQCREPQVLIEISRQELSKHIQGMDKGLNTIKVIASIAPLLGLLGTVVGVLVAFRVMSQSGLNNPSQFAEGISMALLTTVGGMIVAIPHYIGHNYLIGMLDHLECNLEKELLSKVL